MSLFLDSLPGEASPFVQRLRQGIDTVLTEKSAFYAFDFYADRPAKCMEHFSQFVWMVDDACEMGRMSDASQSTADSRGICRESCDVKVLLEHRDEEEDEDDCQEALAARLPMFHGKSSAMH